MRPTPMTGDAPMERLGGKSTVAGTRGSAGPSAGVDASFARAVALHQQGRLDEAEPLYRAVLDVDRRHFGALQNLGVLRRQQGRAEEAARVLREALAVDPNSASAHNNLGNVLALQGRGAAAIAAFERAVALKPDFVEAHYNLGNALAALGRLEEAAQSFERAIALKPDHAEAYNNLGIALQELGRYEEAIACCEKARTIRPTHANAHNNLGTMLRTLGRLDEARDAFERAVALDPRRGAFYYNLADCKTFRDGDPHLASMLALAEDLAALAEEDRMPLQFALGKALADLGARERSFAHLREANATKRRRIVYDEAAALGQLARIPAAFTPELMRPRAGQGHPSAAPVFIVGMLRSGTTLIEQILASHPSVHAAGELQDFDKSVNSLKRADGGPLPFPEGVRDLSADQLRVLGARYLDRVRRLAPSAERITDKMPSNFRVAGLIHLALPNARIIHARRDAADTCLSCFSKLFTGDQPYAYDLAELGRYYRAYDAVMAHWRRVLPDGVMLEVQYEELVADFESQARRIVAHCGLAWSDACLAFHERSRPVQTASAAQVRRPVYRQAVGRALAYGELLRPLFDALGEAARSRPSSTG